MNETAKSIYKSQVISILISKEGKSENKVKEIDGIKYNKSNKTPKLKIKASSYIPIYCHNQKMLYCWYRAVLKNFQLICREGSLDY